MNWKKFAFTAIALFLASNVLGFVIHSWLLHDDYAQFPNLLRTEEEAGRYWHFMLLGMISASLAFAWIYAQGVEDKPWVGQGLRFGVAVWMLTSVPYFLTYYTVQPWPGMLVAKQIGFEFVGALLMGLLAAAIYRK